MSFRPVIDPHFHCWTSKIPNANLGDITSAIPEYNPTTYSEDARTAKEFDVQRLVHVEAIVGQKEGGVVLDTVGETRHVCGLDTAGRQIHLVVYVNLTHDVAKTLDEHAAIAGDRLRGVRMILNHHSNPSLTWPQVAKDYTTAEASEGIIEG
jgi:predicted TIM-barrel fold metal-dependent hydrolase